MRKILLATLVLLIVSLSNLYAWPREFLKEYALLKFVEINELVVVGRVTGKEFVMRTNIIDKFTTDITVTVDEVIKGTPNHGTDRVKFMIRGGEGLHPVTGEPISMGVSDQPDFTLGDKVMLFLTNGESKEPDNVHRPYNRYRIARGTYGRRLVVDDKVYMDYLASDSLTDNSLKSVEMPLDMAVDLAKAFGRDKDAAILLENTIKNLVNISSDDLIKLNATTIQNIKTGAKQILDRPEGD